MNAEKQNKKPLSHVIQSEKGSNRFIENRVPSSRSVQYKSPNYETQKSNLFVDKGNQTIQRYFVVNSNRVKRLPTDLTQQNIKGASFCKILFAWNKDQTEHSYKNWNEAEQAIILLVAQREKIDDILLKADGTIKHFHENQDIDPVWIEQINRMSLHALLLDKTWPQTHEQLMELVKELSHILKKPKMQNSSVETTLPLPGKRCTLLSPQPTTEHLKGMKSNLLCSTHATRFTAIGKLRGTDNEELLQDNHIKGAILSQFIIDSRLAIAKLISVLGEDTMAIFSLERGGSLLADHILRVKQNLLNVKVPKIAAKGSTYSREKHHLRLILKMMDAEEGMVFKMLSKNPTIVRKLPLITFAITETAISGSSVNTLLKTLKQYSMLLPYTKFRILVEKQTIKDEDFNSSIPGKLKVSDSKIKYKENVCEGDFSRIEMFIAQTQYIIGEDVGYQVSYNSVLRGTPLVIFDETGTNLITMNISSGRMKPRDLIIELVAGSYDAALKEAKLL